MQKLKKNAGWHCLCALNLCNNPYIHIDNFDVWMNVCLPSVTVIMIVFMSRFREVLHTHRVVFSLNINTHRFPNRHPGGVYLHTGAFYPTRAPIVEHFMLSSESTLKNLFYYNKKFCVFFVHLNSLYSRKTLILYARVTHFFFFCFNIFHVMHCI